MTNKRWVKHTAWTMVITSILVIWPSISQAYSDTGGRLIAATPFDLKVYATGMLSDEVFSKGSLQKQSVEGLFSVARSFRYVHVAGRRWQTPEETQARGSGDCADKAVWLYTQLKTNGYEAVRLVIGKYRKIDAVFHVWVVYTDLQGRSLLLDPAIQKRVWEVNRFGEGYYRALYSYEGESRYGYEV